MDASTHHPIAAIFPLMGESELRELADDIAQLGLQQPIITFEDKILDGRNRQLACRLAGVKPRYEEFRGNTVDAIAYVWSMNRQRRQLTSSQAAIAQAKRDAMVSDAVDALKAEAEKRKKANLKRGKESPVTQKIEERDSPDDRNERTTDAARAKANGTNRTYIAAADRIVRDHPEFIERIESGELTVSQAKAEIRREQRRRELEEAAAAAKARQEQHESERPAWTIINTDVMDGLQSISDEWGPSRLIVTDPPYNIGIDYGSGKKADMLSPDAYMAWVRQWLSLCVECLTDDGSLWVVIGDEYAADYCLTLRQLGLTIRNWIKWYETFGVNCKDKFNRTSRHIFYCVWDPESFVFDPEPVTRESDRQAKYRDKRASSGGKLWDDVWQIPRLTGTCKERVPDVPTQIPLALLRPIIKCASLPGDLVVDPFAGSGSTGVASVEEGRKFVGVELNDHYADIAEKRIVAAGGCLDLH